jgi:hypothetical protein
MATKLFLRNTALNGIGSTYLDMLTTAGAGIDTIVVDTAASGTEIQWTVSSGGAVRQWVSQPVAVAFTLTTCDVSIWALESNMNANCGGRFRLFKRESNGTETELGGGPFNDGVEFGTVATEMAWIGNVTDTAFAVGDRILLKLYITNIGTMAGAFSCTLSFNAADAATGDSFLNLNENVVFAHEASVAESLNLADTLTAARGLTAALANENVKIRDVGPEVTPIEVSVSESLKLSDIGRGVALLLGAVHIGDGPASAELFEDTGSNLSRSVSQEVLRLAETVTVARDLTASLSDDLKLSDGPVAARTNPDHVTLAEILLLADTLTAARDLTAEQQDDLKLSDGPVAARTNPDHVVLGPDVLLLADTLTAARDITANLQEDLKLADTLTATRDITASLQEGLSVVDEVAARTNPDHVVLSETLLLADTLAASRDLTASLQEDLKLADTLSAAILIEALLAEALKLADTVAALLNPEQAAQTETLLLADTVATTLDPEQASATEALKLADTVTTSLDPEEASASEALKVQDTVAALLVVDLSVSLAESVRILDFVFGAARFVASQNTRTAGLMELPAFKLADGPVVPAMQLAVAVDAEAVRISDTVGAQGDTLLASVAEALKLADTVSVTLDPEEASIAETPKLSDTITAARDIEATLADELRLADALQASRGLDALLSEVLILADAVAPTRDLEVLVGGELLRVQDENPSGQVIAGQQVTQVETLRLADAVAAELDPLQAMVDEVVRAVETLALASSYRIITSMSFGSEALSASAFSTEALSGAVFADEALSDPTFSDEALLPS